MLNLTFTFQQGKRIEKIGRLEESREMREYQSCLLKTNPKWGPTQVQRDLSPIWGVKLCLISVWWGMINVEATLQACARWSDILFCQDLKKKLFFSMQNPGELVIFTVVNRKKSPTMCCKLLCCNAFRDLNCTSVNFIYPVYCKLSRYVKSSAIVQGLVQVTI